MNKAEIRKQIKEQIDAMTEEERKRQSAKVCTNILASKDYTYSTTILAYMPLADEVDITPIIQSALARGKKLFLPRVISGTSSMEFYRYTANTSTEKGDFGITEPIADKAQSFKRFLEHLTIQQYSPAAHSSNFVDIEEHNQPEERILVLIPGRAFTKDGKRIGRGKGFYDIYFSKIPLVFEIKKTGVCFDCQLMADLPTTPDDILMDSIFCPSL